MENVKRLGPSLIAWVMVIGYASIMFQLSSRPAANMPRWPILSHDKLIHCGEYTIFTFLIALALNTTFAPRFVGLIAIALAVVFGVSDEFHQTFVPGRSGNDLGDLAADTMGAVLGASIMMALRSLRRRTAS